MHAYTSFQWLLCGISCGIFQVKSLDHVCQGRFSFLVDDLVVSDEANPIILKGLLTWKRENERLDFKLLNDSKCQFYYIERIRKVAGWWLLFLKMLRQARFSNPVNSKFGELGYRLWLCWQGKLSLSKKLYYWKSRYSYSSPVASRVTQVIVWHVCLVIVLSKLLGE